MDGSVRCLFDAWACCRRCKTGPGWPIEKLTHPDVGYSQAEDLMVAAEGAVETRVLRRQGDTARWSGLDSNSRATL